MPKFNTMLDVAFTVEHDCKSAEEIPALAVLAALEKRVLSLRNGGAEFNRDDFGVCDTYEIESEEKHPEDKRVSELKSKMLIVTGEAKLARELLYAMCSSSCHEFMSAAGLVAKSADAAVAHYERMRALGFISFATED